MISKRKRIFILVPAFHDTHFYANVLQALIENLDERNIDVVVKTHKNDFCIQDQSIFFKKIIDNKHEYLAGIVVPIKADEQTLEIQSFVQKFGKPVIFLDVKPFKTINDYSENSWYVGYNNAIGGDLAADKFLEIFRKTKNESPNILIICGRAQKERQDNFTKRIKMGYSNATFVRKDGQFQRKPAQEMTIHVINEMSKEHLPPFDGIFCTNDEMALGVLDAFYSLKMNYNTTLIGYDGLNAVREIIRRGDTILKFSVEQNTQILAEKTVVTLIEILDNNQSKIPKELLLPPRLIP